MLLCSCLRRFAVTARRYYRIYPGRKRVQVETKIKSPKRYDELRGGSPKALLQGNLFTPESAGPRELAMLCFRIVSMGYADAGVLLRYATCTLNGLSRLKIKHIALILQAISKFLATNPSVVSKSGETELASFQEEIANREKLLIKVKEIAEAVEPQMFKLFARAVPKDLGMIALSMVTVCECAYHELDAEQHSALLSITERTLKLIAEAMGPKLLFCEAPEYAALAKAFCKLPPKHEFVELFLRDLAEEVSSLLSEKHEQLEEIAQGNHIGDDLLESLLLLPRELTTIACALSRRVHHHRIWERMAQCLEHLLQFDTSDDVSNAGLDGQTLILLATSLNRHVDVGFLLEAMVSRPYDPRKTNWLITGIFIALRTLDDVDLAQRMWDAINFDLVHALDDIAKTQLVHVFIRIPSVTNNQKDTIRSLVQDDASPELLVALYAAGHRCGIEAPETLLNPIMDHVSQLSVNSLIYLLRSVRSDHIASPDATASQVQSGMKDRLLKVLSDKIDDIHIDKLYPLLIYMIDNHGGHTAIIEKMVSRVANASAPYEDHHMALLMEKLRDIGIRPDHIFEESLVQRLVGSDAAAEQHLIDRFVEVSDADDGTNVIKFCDMDETEVAKLAKANEGPAPNLGRGNVFW
ncbi:uncharacterized protein BXIN_2604 [Babesia sp. Xinjiang]|uniref:uncharacterized protein n=1 Tax=Babesia sp. Xinjiang TaxID=462227 RepID=UPI000A24E1FA|nr:uncharacterized protein BXIN_2717 [Babesia sp. Xinjiang]XP_028872044.1 uncharacterized protein BXIN_2604 [Babesia sp. Xinjiang]ORM41557.1 hypothetical protein BXIN_2717 [Babesia sp. Xinjiang]ORM41588.1 hypothetical protein BXIN_2604 [Babesia sp. Xinjiang]